MNTSKRLDLSGAKFNNLLAIQYEYSKNKHSFWSFLCDCGNTVTKEARYVKNGRIKSCGCLRYKTSSIIGKKYGKLTKEEGYSTKRYLYNLYRKGARRRNYTYELSFQETIDLTSQNCYYCGIAPYKIIDRDDYFGSYTYNGIDRIDNSKGYSVENCVPCCFVCNRAKGIMTQEQFKEWVDSLYNHYIKEYTVTI